MLGAATVYVRLEHTNSTLILLRKGHSTGFKGSLIELHLNFILEKFLTAFGLKMMTFCIPISLLR